MQVIDSDSLFDVLDDANEARGMRVVMSGHFATPLGALAIVDEALPEYRLVLMNSHLPIPDRHGVTLESAFLGPTSRKLEKTKVRYIPSRLSQVPALFRSTLIPDVVIVHTTLGENGMVSLGSEVNCLPAAISAVKARGGLAIAVANEAVPYTYGDSEYYANAFDYIVPMNSELTYAPKAEPTLLQKIIAENVAMLIPEYATLQVGIGAVPNAVCEALENRHDLSVYTEMFSDGVMGLEQAGAIGRSSPLITSFVLGSAELFKWLDHNSRVLMFRTEQTNDPSRISGYPRMVSLNAAMQIDLHGQVNASYVNGQVHSGFGGATDYLVGALHSKNGRAIIALPSWHPKANVSTIVREIEGPVTSFQPSYIVTEYGVAELLGHDEEEQARSIINIAHPSVRNSLS